MADQSLNARRPAGSERQAPCCQLLVHAVVHVLVSHDRGRDEQRDHEHGEYQVRLARHQAVDAEQLGCHETDSRTDQEVHLRGLERAVIGGRG